MFNPSKRAALRQREIDRSLFWYEVKLYAKVLAIVAIPFALVLWGMLWLMDRI